MTEATRTRTWRDRWIWVFLAVATLVFVVVAAGGWWRSHEQSQRIEDRYTCAIQTASTDC